MSENLKRAESLFNRIMNQTTNNDSSTSSFASQSSTSTTPILEPSPTTSNTTTTNASTSRPNILGSRKFNSSSYSVPTASSNIPKLDIEKLTREALASVPESHHTLPYCWTIWYHSRNKKKEQGQKVSEELQEAIEEQLPEQQQQQQQQSVGVDSYLQTTNELEFIDFSTGNPIHHIASLEQLWSSFSSIKKTYTLNIGTEFLIFKTGVNPVWEDPINSKGGRWVFRFNRKIMDGYNNNDKKSNKQELFRKRTSLIWERLVLKTLTGSLIPDSNSSEIQELLLNDICGLVLSVRKDEDIISLWNSNLNFFGKKDQTKKLTSFQARRIICDSILRVIRECDLINQGSDCVETIDTGSNERVFGVSFDYRIHADNEREREKSIASNGANGSTTGGSTGSNSGQTYGNHYNRRYNKYNSNNSNSNSNTASKTDSTAK